MPPYQAGTSAQQRPGAPSDKTPASPDPELLEELFNCSTVQLERTNERNGLRMHASEVLKH
eukprot:7794841-Alexandrium_andersonii.AAC.1